MDNKLLFLIGCIGVRTALALLAKYISNDYLPYLGYLALLPAFGFIFLYLSDLRQTGPEAQGVIWWNKLRPIHGIMYLLFAIYAIKKESFAWTILAFDVFLGFSFWVAHRIYDVSFL